MYTLGSFTWCWGHVSIYSARFGDNWLRTQSFWWHHILKQSLYLSGVTSISCRSVIPQGAHTICWCSRLLFYSKCTGLTNAYQVFFISFYFTICLTTSNKKKAISGTVCGWHVWILLRIPVARILWDFDFLRGLATGRLDGFSIGRYEKNHESFDLYAAKFESRACDFGGGKLLRRWNPFKTRIPPLSFYYLEQSTANSKWTITHTRVYKRCNGDLLCKSFPLRKHTRITKYYP